jgi:hypothetical protein
MINKAIQPLTTTDADVLKDLDDIEHMAVELATLAGAEIVTTAARCQRDHPDKWLKGRGGDAARRARATPPL